jgi:cupin superfamily acireductone dioxygenase involved in methionine salvage
MIPEHRLDRAERVLMLIVKAGYRARQRSREQDEKINILLNCQIKTDEQLRAHSEQLRAQSEQSRAQDEKLKILIDAQMKTDEQLKSLREGQAALQVSMHEGHSRLEKVMAELAEEHKATERSLKAFLDGLKGKNGRSSP